MKFGIEVSTVLILVFNMQSGVATDFDMDLDIPLTEEIIPPPRQHGVAPAPVSGVAKQVQAHKKLVRMEGADIVQPRVAESTANELVFGMQVVKMLLESPYDYLTQGPVSGTKLVLWYFVGFIASGCVAGLLIYMLHALIAGVQIWVFGNSEGEPLAKTAAGTQGRGIYSRLVSPSMSVSAASESGSDVTERSSGRPSPKNDLGTFLTKLVLKPSTLFYNEYTESMAEGTRNSTLTLSAGRRDANTRPIAGLGYESADAERAWRAREVTADVMSSFSSSRESPMNSLSACPDPAAATSSALHAQPVGAHHVHFHNENVNGQDYVARCVSPPRKVPWGAKESRMAHDSSKFAARRKLGVILSRQEPNGKV